jgi:hypothetical protein
MTSISKIEKHTIISRHVSDLQSKRTSTMNFFKLKHNAILIVELANAMYTTQLHMAVVSALCNVTDPTLLTMGGC